VAVKAASLVSSSSAQAVVSAAIKPVCPFVPSVPERKQTKRQEQEREKDDVTRRQYEHDHSYSESDREQAHR
jgi:hypothetical protein